MLVLTRKCQEKIQIGDNITITIVRVKGQSVRVGIDAPREMKVVRTELPPESPSGQAPAGGEPTDTPARAESASPRPTSQPQCRAPGSDLGEGDCRASFAADRQPLARYIPGTRMLVAACSG